MAAPRLFGDHRGITRVVPMQVLCMGMSRSGTESLCKALEILGIPTYHGFHIHQNPLDAVLWQEAVDSKYYNKGKLWTREDFDQILGEYSATTDFPASAFVTELIEAYPEAKVILNKRPFEKWNQSYLRAFQPLIEDKVLYFITFFDRTLGNIWSFWVPFLQMYFRYDYPRNARRIYEEHNALVRGAAMQRQFLEWDVVEGWEPLCSFLNKPIPKEPFPSGNGVEEFFDKLLNQILGPMFQRAFRNMAIAGVTIAGGAGFGVVHYMYPAFLAGGFGSVLGR